MCRSPKYCDSFAGVEQIPARLQQNKSKLALRVPCPEMRVSYFICLVILLQVEEELRHAIVSWERDNENVLLVNGERYLDVMERQRLEHEEEKKKLVAERVHN